MLRFATALLLVALSCTCLAESISFEIYELSGSGKRTLLTKGTKEYGLPDIQTVEHRFPGPQRWTKILDITDRFYVGASIYREPQVGGFGLWIKQRPQWYEFWKNGGFSWEWFSPREPGNVFRKLQGPGRVRVSFIAGVNYEEIATIEFLDDVTVRLKDRPWFFFSNDDTHHVMIGKGSVFRLAP